MNQDQELNGAREMTTRMDRMEMTVESLIERVRALERMAAHDEAKLSAEIEKLRGR